MHPHTGEAGAIGAAMETLRVVKRKGALDVHRHRCGDRPRVHDEERRRDGLPLLPEQLQAHVHRHDAPRRLDQPLHRRLLLREGHRREQGGDARRSSRSARRSPSSSRTCVDYEAKRAFMHVYDTAPMPAEGSPIEDIEVKKGIFGHAARRGQAPVPALVARRRGRRAARSASASRASSTSTRPGRSSARTSRRSASRRRTSSSATRRPRSCGSRAASTARSTRATRARSRRRTSTTCSSTSTPRSGRSSTSSSRSSRT